MTTAIAIAVLAYVDCLLSGFRSAAGKDGRLDKRAYYVRAVLRAGAWGLLCVGSGVLVALALCWSSSDPARAFEAMTRAGRVLVIVYGSFAALILSAFAFYFSPIGDLRVLTNVVVFGPLTLARPWVIVAGLAAAVLVVPDPRVAGIALVAGALMLSFEGILRRRYRPALPSTQWDLHDDPDG